MRSYLYVPGDAPDQLAAALGRDADAVVLDLDAAVPAAAKDSAREAVREWLARQRRRPPAQSPPAPARSPAGQPTRPARPRPAVPRAIWVRINPGPLGHLDARAVVSPALTGLCVAQASSATELAALGAVVAEVEEGQGLPVGHLAVAPVLQTAAAVLSAAEIARAPRVTRLQLGEAYLCAELGIAPGPDERELLWVRTMVVLASAAAGIDPPVGPASAELTDLNALRDSTLALRRLGFRGRGCIHPAQLPVVNEVFAGTDPPPPAPRDAGEVR